MHVFSKNVLIHLLWALFCEFPSFLPFLLWQCFCFFNLSRCHIQQTYCIVLKTFFICKKICLLLGLLFFWTNLDIASLPLILRMCFSSGLCLSVIKKKKRIEPFTTASILSFFNGIPIYDDLFLLWLSRTAPFLYVDAYRILFPLFCFHFCLLDMRV